MTIHPIRMSGLVIGVPQTFEYMEKMQERVVRFVTSHSGITEEQFKDLMFKTGELNRDIGTAVSGADAVKYGLMNEVGGIGQALSRLNSMIAERKTIQPGDYAMTWYSVMPLDPTGLLQVEQAEVMSRKFESMVF